MKSHLQKKIRDYGLTPILGFLPFVVYIVLRYTLQQEGLSLLIALGLSGIGGFLSYIYARRCLLDVSFMITGLSLFLTILVWYFTFETILSRIFYLIICEISIALICILLTSTRRYINLRFFRYRRILRVPFDNLHFIAYFLQFAFTVHLFAILINLFLIGADGEVHPLNSFVFYFFIPFGIIVGAYISYMYLRVINIKSKMEDEEWLPIITEKGDVTGKIAKSVSFNMKNRYLHPVVRTALVAGDKLYLQKRKMTDILDPDKLDYPFEKYVLFDHQINIAVRNSITCKIKNGSADLHSEYLLKYNYENKDTKRLIFLYVIKLEDEDALLPSAKLSGKFWTIRQIEDSFGDNIFSECFELEYEYIKNKVLLPDNIHLVSKAGR